MTTLTLPAGTLAAPADPTGAAPDRPRRRPWRRRAVLITLTLLTVAVLLCVAVPIASAGTTNPLGGITPDITVFGGLLNTTWKRVAAGLWGAVLAYTGVQVIMAGAKSRQARRAGMAGGLTDSHEEFITALTAFGIVACASMILGAVLFMTGT